MKKYLLKMWKRKCLDMFDVPPLLSVVEASFGEVTEQSES
jgi:hypothetical protein